MLFASPANSIRVKKRYGDFFIDVDFEIPATGVTVFFGPSGAGKTTLLDMIAGLVMPDEGVIRFGDSIFFDSSGGVCLSLERRALGYVFQQHRLFSHMSVKGNMTFASKCCGRPLEDGRFEKVVDVLGIAHLLERKPASLSGGESQRVAIGRALLATRSLLLMDEPLSSLVDEAMRLCLMLAVFGLVAYILLEKFKVREM